MDSAVSLVQTYLRVNGYFTVTEYPLVEIRGEDARTLTDLDVLAFRFPGAGRPARGRRGQTGGPCAPADPVLGCPEDRPDMLIGEVKEGRAQWNAAGSRPEVIAAGLTRFGCCSPGHAHHIAEAVLRDGEATTHDGHMVRLVVFSGHGGSGGPYRVVHLGHVLDYLLDFLQEEWPALGHTELKDPTLGLLATLARTHPRHPGQR